MKSVNFTPVGYMSLESKKRGIFDETQTAPLEEEVNNSCNLLFNVYRDQDVGLSELNQCMEELNLSFEEPAADPDCESDEDAISWDKNKCFSEFSQALKECDSIGPELVTTVLLRNPDI
jgi:hypothetical protein